MSAGTLQGQELFLFTDNWVFENCYYKGHSASEKLSDIILRLHLAQRSGRLILHVIHVAGTRMKDWGVDGLSRGDQLEGFLARHDQMTLVPLWESAIVRASGQLRTWLDGWWGGGLARRSLFLLQTTGSSSGGYQGPACGYPPAAMETVIEVSIQ